MAFFFQRRLNYVMLSTNNKINNKNPAETCSLAGSECFFYIPFVIGVGHFPLPDFSPFQMLQLCICPNFQYATIGHDIDPW